MADVKKGNTATPTAKAPETPKPAPTTAPNPPAEEPKKAKRVKTVWTKVFPTPEAAVEEAKKRTKGPRRAFTCTAPDGKVIHVVGHNEGRAGGIAFEEIGGKVQEIGRAAKVKAVGVDGVMAAINALPEEERAKVLEALAALNKK